MYKILLSVATAKWFQDALEDYKDVQLQEKRSNAAFSLGNRDCVRGNRCHARHCVSLKWFVPPL